MRYQQDEIGRWLGTCLYCMRQGTVGNLRRLPYDRLNREYCPRCFYGVLAHDMKLKKQYEEMLEREAAVERRKWNEN